MLKNIKNVGNKSSLVENKQEAIYKAYKNAIIEYNELEASGNKPKEDIHRWILFRAANTRQPRFWITPGRAARIIASMLKGKRMRTFPERKAMHHELMQAYRKLKKNAQYKAMSLSELSYYIVLTPCSGFFMSPHRIYRAVIARRAFHRKQRAL